MRFLTFKFFKRPLPAALCALALGLPALAQTPAAPKPGTTVATAAREIKWDELLPPGWDPMKDFKSAGYAGLSDADPRAAAALKDLRDAWDKAPLNTALDGQVVKLPGFVVPLDEGKAGLTEFLLVPYFGACIHTPAPPANQVVHVLPRTAAKGLRSMDTVWVSGTLHLDRSDTYLGASGYRIDALKVEPYVQKPR
jgi:hypothetical protein